LAHVRKFPNRKQTGLTKLLRPERLRQSCAEPVPQQAELDNDTSTIPPFDRFEDEYLDSALSRPPECAEWLRRLAGCEGVVEAAVVEPASGVTLLTSRS
jgi:hypothetical protein